MRAMRIWTGVLAAAVVLGLGLAGCDGGGGGEGSDAGTDTDTDADAGPDSGGDTELAFPSTVDGTRMQGFLQDLSSEDMGGRLTGTATGDLAEAYCTSALEAAGLTPTKQEVTFPVYEVGSPISLIAGDKTFVYIDEYREVAHAGSGAVEAPLLFLGNGSDDDYAALDAAGKVVAILAGDMDAQFGRAHANGAVGVLYLSYGSIATYDEYYGMVYIPNLFGAFNPVDTDLLFADLPALFVRSNAVDDLLEYTPDELGADPTPFDPGLTASLELHGSSQPEATCNNLLVEIPGTNPDLASEVLLVGAHYDHVGTAADGRVFTGASDNGSGSAAMLELATVLAGVGAPPERTVLLALWCAEEQGIYGSYHYVDDEPLLPLEDTFLTVNLDNIADPPGPYLVREEETPIQEVFLGASPDSVTETSLAFQCGSDECPFFQDAGIPFLRYMDFGSDGHTFDDTFEQADLAGMEQVANEVLAGIGAVAWSDEPLE